MISLLRTSMLAVLAAGGCLLHADSAVGQSLDGTWVTSVTFTNTPAGFPSMFNQFDTYIPGGGYVAASNVVPQASHGQWERVGDHQFVVTFQFFLFDSKGNYAGYVRVRLLQQLEATLDHMHGVFTSELHAPDGTLINSANRTAQSQRMDIAAPDITLN